MLDFHLLAQSVCSTIGMLGIGAEFQEPAESCGSFRIENDVVILIGIIGSKKYNAAFSLKNETACRIAGTMMGTGSCALDEMGRSAVAELVNMISGNLVSSAPEELSEITLPTLVSGTGVCCVMQSFQSEKLRFQTTCGPVEVSIALEG